MGWYQNDVAHENRCFQLKMKLTEALNVPIIQFLIAGCAAGIIRPSYGSASVDYDFKPFGNLRLIHITDTHAQLDPMYFREPNFNLGVGVNKNTPPHIIGKKLLDYYSIDSTLLKYAYIRYIGLLLCIYSI